MRAGSHDLANPQKGFRVSQPSRSSVWRPKMIESYSHSVRKTDMLEVDLCTVSEAVCINVISCGAQDP